MQTAEQYVPPENGSSLPHHHFLCLLLYLFSAESSTELPSKNCTKFNCKFCAAISKYKKHGRSSPYSVFRFRLILHCLCIKSGHDHMYDIRNQDHRNRKVGDGTVRLLDQGQKTKLGNRKVCGTTDQGRNNFFF